MSASLPRPRVDPQPASARRTPRRRGTEANPSPPSLVVVLPMHPTTFATTILRLPLPKPPRRHDPAEEAYGLARVLRGLRRLFRKAVIRGGFYSGTGW